MGPESVPISLPGGFKPSIILETDKVCYKVAFYQYLVLVFGVLAFWLYYGN